jgi:hypothetical protein
MGGKQPSGKQQQKIAHTLRAHERELVRQKHEHARHAQHQPRHVDAREALAVEHAHQQQGE